MTVARPALLGLLLGAVLGFAAALLRPRSRSAYTLSGADPAQTAGDGQSARGY